MSELEDWFFKFNAWSLARHQLMKFCKRAYYYRYIGQALKSSLDYDVEELKKLKKLNSKYVIQGSLIHEVIENQITQHYFGRDLSEESAKNQFSRKLEDYKRNSDKKIIQLANGEELEDDFFETIHKNGIEQINNFFEIVWPNLRDLEYLRHEQFDEFFLNETKVLVKIDYITKNKEGNLVITDWKTGKKHDDKILNLQIAAYVLWAMYNYSKTPEEIFSEVIYLNSGQSYPYQYSWEQINEIKDFIIDDFEKMNSSYDIGEYSADPHPKKCINCHFATVCPDSEHMEYLQSFSSSPEDEDEKFNEMLIDMD